MNVFVSISDLVSTAVLFHAFMVLNYSLSCTGDLTGTSGFCVWGHLMFGLMLILDIAWIRNFCIPQRLVLVVYYLEPCGHIPLHERSAFL